MSTAGVFRSADRSSWEALVDPPGEIPSGGRELTLFTSPDDRFTCGFWEREPDTWSFERPYDEVASILSGSAEMDTVDGRTLRLGPGDVLVTPKGSKGTWRIEKPLTKFFAIYAGGATGDTDVRVIHDGDSVEWVVLETAEDDPTPPGEEWYAHRNADGKFSTGAWRRAAETGPMELEYDEIVLLIEGEVDVTSADGQVLSAGPGDVLVTPSGFVGTWQAKSAVRKFWVVHR
jgi:uncharacterized protein